jgi:hypothetical protein
MRSGERREEEIQATPEIQGALPPLVLVAASMEDPASYLPSSHCIWRRTVVENEGKGIGFDGAAAGWALDGPPESFLRTLFFLV